MNKTDFKYFNLDEDIMKSIEKLGYKYPSKVQEKVIPLILRNKDVVVKSQTGSGKTAAFAIPICQNINLEEKLPQVLVLSPTRELAIQTKEDFSNIGKFKRINCIALFGKEPATIQIRELKQRVHVVVGTPGRTLDHIKRGTLDTRKINYLVIDEADEMLNMGFIDQVKSIIDRIPKGRYNSLFSATISQDILDLCKIYMNDPINIEIRSEKPVLKKIKQIYYEVESYKKFQLLNEIIYTENPESAMIFCMTKKNVDILFFKMKEKGYSCNKLHGSLLQKDRIDVIRRFKRGEFMFLICTDIAARGIDVENVTHIINYDIPMEKESYIHRIGRTARAGKDGKAITFVTSRELRFLTQLAQKFDLNIEKGKIPTKKEIECGKKIFYERLKSGPKIKEDKSKNINKDIMKIYINAGRKKKIRPGDIAGTISSIDGINPDDIGIIDISDNFSYVDILSGKGNLALEGLKYKRLKGRKIRSERAQK